LNGQTLTLALSQRGRGDLIDSLSRWRERAGVRVVGVVQSGPQCSYDEALKTTFKVPPMLTVDVRSRVEPELKREAAAVLKASGLDVSTAIRLFLRSVVEKSGMPMELPRANPVTLAAIKAANFGKTTTRITLEDL